MKPDIQNIQIQINELKARLDAKNVQQLTIPFDLTSKNIISKDVPIYKSKTAGSPTTNGYITVNINGNTFHIMTTT